MQDVGSTENTRASKGAQRPDSERRLSNALDTVSLLEIGCFSGEGSREAEKPSLLPSLFKSGRPGH